MGFLYSESSAEWDDSSHKREYVECSGDYRNEVYLEENYLPLYAHQQSLPRLPVPTLDQTIRTFLPTALPFAQHADEAARLEDACRVFPEQAKNLQERLLKRKDTFDNSSWLQQWWNDSYMTCRDSLFHISYFYRLAAPAVPMDAMTRAAHALHAALIFAETILSGQRPPDTMGKQRTPLCSTQYKYLFHSCRIPHRQRDSFRIYHKCSHVAVASRGQFYKILVRDPSTGKILSTALLQVALRECVHQSLQPSKVPELGWLSATDRDTWADSYTLLEQHASQALDELQSAFCMVCLDDTPGFSDREMAQRLWHGNVVHSNNRWCDKSFQLVVSEDGELGYVGEHCMSDGMPSITLCHFILDNEGQQDDGVVDSTIASQHPPLAAPIFEATFQNMSPSAREEIQDCVDAARMQVMTRIQEHDLEVLNFTDCGNSLIKRSGFSPDAFVQVGLQLAGYRLFGTVVGTYESTQTRRFLHGRTETTRGVSLESQAFVRAMSNGNGAYSKEEKLALLDRATTAHWKYTQNALEGRGADRHLLGLTMLLERGETSPDLLVNPIYLASKRWRMSTSTVPRGRAGFSNVERDGLGIAYDAQDDYIVFTVTGRKEYGFAGRMKILLEESLLEMVALFPEPPTSNL